MPSVAAKAVKFIFKNHRDKVWMCGFHSYLLWWYREALWRLMAL